MLLYFQGEVEAALTVLTGEAEIALAYLKHKEPDVFIRSQYALCNML